MTRRDLIPAQPYHPRADEWYYRLALGLLYHKLPPNVSDTWRRITFIVSTRNQFETAEEIEDLLADQSSSGHRFVTLKEQQLKFEDGEIG